MPRPSSVTKRTLNRFFFFQFSRSPRCQPPVPPPQLPSFSCCLFFSRRMHMLRSWWHTSGLVASPELTPTDARLFQTFAAFQLRLFARPGLPDLVLAAPAPFVAHTQPL